MKNLLVLCLLLVWAAVQPLQARLNLLFTTDHQLPNSLVNCVAEDADEMIWVATEDGLCRYNGSRFINYRNQPDNPNSIQNNFVRAVCCDPQGHVLVCTLAGVQLYRPQTDDFTPLIYDQSQGITPGNISWLTLLSSGNFIATGNLVYEIHIDEEGQPHAVANALTHKFDMALKACEDTEGNLWVIRSNDGIFRLNKQGEIEEIRKDNTSYGFTSMGIGPDGSVYAGGLERGLFRFDAQRSSFVEVTDASHRFMVKAMLPIQGTQRMYVATDGDGIQMLDCQTRQFTPFIFDDALVDPVTQKVHSLLVSRNGDLWMALYQKGVFVVSQNSIDFKYYGPRSIRYNCVGDRCVTTLLRTPDGTLWVGTDNGGLYGVNSEGQMVAHYNCGTSPGAVPSSLMKLFLDSRGRCWYGSYRQGGGIVNLSTGHCQMIPVEGLQDVPTNIYDFVEDKQGNIWVASMGNGILRYDEQKRTFIPVPLVEACNWTGSLTYEPSTNRLYAGTYTGLVVISLSDSEYHTSQYLPDIVVYSITRISSSQICLCSNRGLVLFDIPSGKYTIYTTDDGLPNNNVYAAQCDADGNLWVSSNGGLSRYNIQEETFTNYTAQEGLMCSEFYKNASMQDADGTLWFGATTGITWFNPRHIRYQPFSCKGRIVNFRAGQKYMQPDAKGIYQIGNEDHSFLIEMATRPLLYTHSVTYRYSLDGDAWQTLPPMTNRVSFSGISSGSHTFRFQVVSEGTTYDEQEARIRIARPWYRSWWGYLIYFVLVCIIIYLLVQRYRRIRYERHLQRAHEREVAINEAKLQLFMNIAHDFRTPMTLVVAPLQKLLNTDKDPHRQRAYQIIDRNANRVLELINELMDLRKIDKAQMKLQCREVAPKPLLDDLCESVSDLAEDRNLTLVHRSGLPEGYTTWIDQVCFDKVFLNLLSNAIKYTPNGGSIQVDTCLDAHGDLQIMVTDTGIGIAPEDRQHIFERFYQVRHSAKVDMGTGIGLNLVQALVRLHHGTIQIEGNPAGQGTRFIVTLPTSQKQYLPQELVTGPVDEPELTQTVTQTAIVHSTLREDHPAEVPSSAGRGSRAVLVVDDDDEVRDYLEHELSPHYRVAACTNGREALEHLLAESYDLVVSDIMMPEVDGVQLCQRIRSNVLLNHLPVILLTAKTSDESRLESLEVGANAFIPKPFNTEILLKTVQNLLNEHDRLRSLFSGQQLPVDQVDTPELQSPDERLLRRIVKIVNENLSNPDLTSELIAQEVGLSRVHLYRKLKELTHQSARTYIRNIRLVKAAELLSHKKMAIAEVAYQVGFANPNNFATAFKELYGVSPTTYNEQHCGEKPSDVTN